MDFLAANAGPSINKPNIFTDPWRTKKTLISTMGTGLRRTSAADRAWIRLPADKSYLPGQVYKATRWGLSALLPRTSPGSPPVAWATNRHRPTWTCNVEDPLLGHPESGERPRSGETFTPRFQPHVSQVSSTIFEGVGTSSRRLETEARFGETLRPGSPLSACQRSISLIKGDRK